MRRSILSLSIIMMVMGGRSVSAGSSLEISMPESDPSIADPPIAEVHNAARRAAHLQDRELTRWSKRAKLAAALPRFEFGLDQKFEDRRTLSVGDEISVTATGVTIGPQTSDFDRDDNDSTGFAVKAVWQLDELLFNRNQILVSQERRHRKLEERDLMEIVNNAYFERQRLKQGIVTLKRGQYWNREMTEIRLKELAATLDGLTDGWFSRQLRGER